jgi:hypothetical protein
MKILDTFVHGRCAGRIFPARAAALLCRHRSLPGLRGEDFGRDGQFRQNYSPPRRSVVVPAEDFVRGWLVTGRTGSGKTQCAINAITYQIFQNVKNWGGVCRDQKGL